jgi:hypothetical protein
MNTIKRLLCLTDVILHLLIHSALKLIREMNDDCSENHATYTDTLFGQNEEFLSVRARAVYVKNLLNLLAPEIYI